MRVITGILIGAIVAALAAGAYLYFTDTENEPSVLSVDAPVSRFADFDDVAYFGALRASPTEASRDVAFDVAALVAALPAPFVVTHGTVAAPGGTAPVIVPDVEITLEGNEIFSVRAEEMRFYGVNGNTLAARLAGERLDETLDVGGRIEITGVNAVGVETIYQSIFDASNTLSLAILDGVMDLDDETSEAVAAASRTDVGDYSMSVGKMVLTDLVLHPFVIDPITFDWTSDEASVDSPEIALDIEDGFGEATGDATAGVTPLRDRQEAMVHVFQQMAAWTRTIALEDFASYDMTLNLTMKDGSGARSKIEEVIPFAAYKAIDRGNIGLSVVRDVTFSADFEFSETAPDSAPSFPIQMSGKLGQIRISDVQLAKVMDYLARGKMPGTEETDLFSLGLTSVENVDLAMNERTLYGLRAGTFDGSRFHGIIPQRLAFDLDDLYVDIEGFVGMMTDFSDDNSGNPDASFGPEARERMDQVMAVLVENDLTVLSADYGAAVRWDEGSGATGVDYKYNVDKFFDFSANGNMQLPSYDALFDHVDGTLADIDGTQIEAVLSETFAFEGMKAELADTGGLKRGFALAVAIADIMPEDDPSMAMLRGADPKDLRLTAATMMRLGAGQMGSVFPPAKDYISAVADFVAKGGRLVVEMNPPEPVTAAMIEDLNEASNPDDPEAIVNLLGFTLKHKN